MKKSVKPIADAPWSEAKLLVALAERYRAPEHAFLRQVRNGTGYQSRARTADALAMSLWPSRGLEILGFELKSDRSDWLREKCDPEKAEEIASRCDRWWVVAGALDVVAIEELPPTWGLMAADGKKLRVLREAPALKPTAPIDRAFLAAILRRASKEVTAGEIEAARELGREEGRAAALEEAERRAPWEVTQLKEALARVQKRLDDFEAKSGVKIDEWSSGEVGEAVRYLAHDYSGERKDVVERFRRLARETREAADVAERALAEMERCRAAPSIVTDSH